MKHNLIFIQLMLLSKTFMFSHDSNVATAKLYQENDNWKLTFSLGSYGLMKGLHQVYRNEEVSLLEMDDFNQKLDAYIQKTFCLTINMHHKIVLEHQSSEVGSHQADIHYVLKGIPPRASHWELDFSTFEQNNAQTNVFKLDIGENSRSFILRKDLDYHVTFLVSGKHIREIN